jgi:HAD superfamily hydrolase (TIGR01484 family)
MIRLLCTDLDRTLLPNGDEPLSPAALPTLRRLIDEAGLILAYVTGRDAGRVQQCIAQYDLPTPRFVVADVGTSIYRVTPSGWQQDPAWQANIAQQWRGLCSSDIQALLHDDSRLTAQEPDRQRRYKQSYYLQRDEDTTALSTDLQQRLGAADINATLVFSDDPQQQQGLLDVLPESASKRHGIEHLRNALGLAVEEVLFAGDSGNDLDVLVSPLPAVLVANADKDVRSAVLRGVADTSHAQSLYLARGELELPDGGILNGNYSAGIVEGLLHFAPALRQMLQRQCLTDYQ